jgi:hypothetical protein
MAESESALDGRVRFDCLDHVQELEKELAMLTLRILC